MKYLLFGLLVLAIATSGCSYDTAGTATTTAGPQVADGSTSLAVSGRLVDGVVTGATVRFFADQTMALALGNVSASTDITGRFSATIPGSSLTGLSTVFVKATGGTDLDTLEPPPEMSATVNAVGGGQVAVTLASSLAVRIMNDDRGATVEQARAQVRALFGLAATFDLDPFDITPSSPLEVVNKTLLVTGDQTHGDLLNTTARTNAALNDVADAVARGALDITALSTAHGLLAGRGLPDAGVVIHAPPEISLGAITLGTQQFSLATTGVIVATDHVREASVIGAIAAVGTALAEVSLDFPDGADSGTATKFTGAIELQIKAAAPDKRLLTLRIDRVDITSAGTSGSPLIVVEDAGTLTAGGTDASGTIVASVTVPSVPSTAPDMITVTPVTGGKRLTLHPQAMSREIAKLLTTPKAAHPSSLLDMAGTVDLTVTLRGFPTRTPNGRLRRIVVPGVARS